MRRFLSGVLCFCFSEFGISQTLEHKLNTFIESLPRPQSAGDFKPVFHLPPLNQDTSLICWSFSTSSFIESEMERLKMKPVRLSLTFPVYNVFLEKARRFVATRGTSRVAPGDLFTGVLDILKMYGAIPASGYGGKETGNSETYNHNALYREVDQLMKRLKADSRWNEANALDETRKILDRHLGRPPEQFIYNGKSYTPKSFFNDVVRLPWNEYVMVTSFQYAPFYSHAELKVPDNWKHDATYFNVPLDVFFSSMKFAVLKGFSLAIDADISEPSYVLNKKYAVIPDFDIPLSSITQEAREFRFDNGATTDDHLLHIVDCRNFDGQDWFLVKDSWRTAWEGSNKGYFFFHESYVKLKVLAYLVHRDGIPIIREKIQ
ncbi:MAG: peptidase C1 [Ignavibacteriales bacterium]|nr:peptidase C1 [Ignavibacteriales bacterium]